MTIRVSRILVPIDFSPHAEAVVEWAGHLAREHGAEVVLLHAYHLPVEFQQLEGAYLPPDFWETVKRDAERSLSVYGDRLRSEGVAVAAELVREGFPTTVIEEEEGTQNADLIVIGSRGLSALKHLLLGSVARRVVQKARCPVLTVKQPA